MRLRVAILAGAVVVLAAVGLALSAGSERSDSRAPAGRADVACELTLEAGGDVEELLSGLPPGTTACLAAGVHETDGDVTVSAADVTLTSAPGEQATLRGRLTIAPTARGATIRDLTLDGSNPEARPSPTVNADAVTFTGVDVSNGNTAICFVVGDGPGRPEGVRIEASRIHHCGELPPTNHHHGVYVADAIGTEILDNVIYDNADRGIQLFPNADGSVIRGNVIDGNGQGIIFSGRGADRSEDNLVERNVIANSRLRYNVEEFWPGSAPGGGNIVRRNCVHGGPRDEGDGGIEAPSEGFTAYGNVVAEPVYGDRAAADFRLERGSKCAELLP